MTAQEIQTQLTPFQQAVRAVRFLSIDAVEQAKSGHPGAPMGLAEIGVEIFANHLRFDPTNPTWENRDRFVLSCGHASMLIYSLLHLSGYELSLDDIKQFRQWGAKTAGHPEFGEVDGVETTTGPLGQGIGNAVGIALGGKMAGRRLNVEGESVIDYDVYVLASDGDIMEGVAYEACSLAGHYKLDNLIVVYDANNVTIDGKTEASFSEDVDGRFRALGWDVQTVDGHDVDAISQALKSARRAKQPALIIAKTHIGFGSPNKQDTSASHGAPLGPEEVRLTKEALGWPLDEPFFVPAGAYDAFQEARARGAAACSSWKERVAGLDDATRSVLRGLLKTEAPADLLSQLVEVAGTADDATRSHAGRIQQKVAELVPSLVGGSADLAGSVKTWIKGGGTVEAGSFEGRNFNFGIREHGMGAICNGLALSGFFLPYASTFLIFGDYMRPPMRLAGLMKQQVVYVFSHDSIFLGEDGPTHQPVEQLWTMRMVPHLDVFRPADAWECAAAWTYAVERVDGPTALSLTRHKVPHLERPPGFEVKSILDGAYVLAEVEDPELVLIATGSEVSSALVVQRMLAEKGKRIRVVSMPCVEAFLRLPQAKRDQILPPGLRRASYELGITFPWKSIVGLDGITIGVDGFGASAPYQVLERQFEVAPDQVAERILAQL